MKIKCPHCRSENVQFEETGITNDVFNGIHFHHYVCLDCHKNLTVKSDEHGVIDILKDYGGKEA